MNRVGLLVSAALVLSACSETPVKPETAGQSAPAAVQLESALERQSAGTRGRYDHRHPRKTLEFFGIRPGMTVLEALPGGGWYSKILVDYLGPDGNLIGADYPMAMWPMFGFFPEEFIEEKKSWVTDWTATANAWRGDSGAPVAAFVFGSMPDKFAGTADVVLFIRALHNLHRFEGQGGFFTTALADAHRALKPGGILGVVQHQAPETMPDERADGSAGYLKKSQLIRKIEQAGFNFVAASAINNNPKDQPGADDVVWRLPPSLVTSREDPELREEMQAIGESNRMTLKFRKR
ncbi:MAG: methyltransferase [Gammaproteobacteria bacterium]|nr:methyltransferase [Gammaproteobacteria bacterium]NNF61814.1 class I SAM-dependent methyltransferase [Gammaproteobacteria bacterium]NNM19738.1 class I SAM-dependent methyltransferase [Gammaproteobacteria bacterium]